MVDYKEVVDSEKEADRLLNWLPNLEDFAGQLIKKGAYGDFAYFFLQYLAQYKYLLIHFANVVAANPQYALTAYSGLVNVQNQVKLMVTDAAILKQIPYKYEAAMIKAANEVIPQPEAAMKAKKLVVDDLKLVKSDCEFYSARLSKDLGNWKPHMYVYSTIREDVFQHMSRYNLKVKKMAELKKTHPDVLKENNDLVKAVVAAINYYRELLVDALHLVIPAGWDSETRDSYLASLKSQFALVA